MLLGVYLLNQCLKRMIGLFGVSALLFGMAPGCSWVDGDVRKSLVLGFAVVEYREHQDDTGVQASYSKISGVLCGEHSHFRGLLVGSARCQQTQVPVDANAVVNSEIKRDGELSVTIEMLP